ncbi:MAG: VOC family protein [Candidatus Dormibacteria bacterium]
MSQTSADPVEILDVVAGLWVWRLRHPGWQPGADWEPVIGCTCVDSGGERLLLDPLAPAGDAPEFWERFAERPPTVVVILKPDHVRDVDLFSGRYGAKAYGPKLFFPDDLPQSRLRPVEPGNHLPGGLVALYDGRGGLETPLWLPEQRAVVFADALTERGGELRVWATAWHEQRTLPALRALLELPFERVIIAHGQPVHSRADYEQALGRPPWPAGPLHLAAWGGSLGLVRHLVEAGANPAATDELRHETPLQWARAADQAEVAGYLESLAAPGSAPAVASEAPPEAIEFLSAVLLTSPDPGRLAVFYRDRLGLPLVEERHDQAEAHWGCELGDVHFAIHPGEPPDGAGPVRLALWVFDLEALVAGLAEQGVECSYPITKLGEGSWVTALSDPDGNQVELTQMSSEWVERLARHRGAGADVIARARGRHRPAGEQEAG